MRSVVPLALLLLLTSAAAGSCHGCPSGAATGGTVGTTIGGPLVLLHVGVRPVPIRVEVARTEIERERGLMFRRHLDTDAGMLFVFERDGPLTFWMRNTFIPLDIIFIDRDRRVVGIVENAVPETDTPRRVGGDSRYVLEVGGGSSRRWGLGAGTLLEFQGLPRDLGAD